MIENWEILDKYYKDNKYYISNIQIDSYNNFIDNKISKTIRQFNPIINSFEDGKIIIESVIGGSLKKDNDGNDIILNDGKGIYYKNPIITDNNKEKSRILYPNECRLKNLTYSFNIYVDIIISYKTFNNSTNNFDIKNVIINDILLGNVPNMLNSNICVLNNLSNNTKYNVGECVYDQGGYFIIDGLEKVIVSQETQFENKCC